MSLIKTSALNGISVATKICSAIVINKALALYVGPSGYSIFGQFQNFLTVATSASGGVFLSGVTKETAENSGNIQLQHDIWATAFRATLFLTVITTLLFAININFLSNTFFSHSDISGAIYLLIFLLPFLVLNNLILSIINGKKQIILYVLVSIICNLVFGLIGAILIFNYGLNGGLCALIISPLIGLLILLIYSCKKKLFSYTYLFAPINNRILYSLVRFSLMGITSAIAVPYTTILIRSYIEANFGLEAAGYWQGVQKISDIYLALLTSTLVLYYLPRIAEINNLKDLKEEIKKVYFLIIPLAITTSLSIYLLRDMIIEYLFSVQFMGMNILFFWQMIGDVFRMGSWVLAYIMIGKGLFKSYISTEIIFCAVFYWASRFFLEQYGLVGSTMGYAACYFLYWVTIFLVIKFQIKKIF